MEDDPYNIFEYYSVFFIARETINDEPIIATFLHSFTQKLHRNLGGHNSPLSNHALDHGSETIHTERKVITLKQEQDLLYGSIIIIQQ